MQSNDQWCMDAAAILVPAINAVHAMGGIEVCVLAKHDTSNASRLVLSTSAQSPDEQLEWARRFMRGFERDTKLVHGPVHRANDIDEARRAMEKSAALSQAAWQVTIDPELVGNLLASQSPFEVWRIALSVTSFIRRMAHGDEVNMPVPPGARAMVSKVCEVYERVPTFIPVAEDKEAGTAAHLLLRVMRKDGDA